MNRKEFLRVLVIFAGAKTAASVLPGCSSGNPNADQGFAGGATAGGATAGGTAGGSGTAGGATAGGATAGGANTAGGAASACTGPINAANVLALTANVNGIESTHMHTLTIPIADITADVDHTYTSQVIGIDHTHSIMLTSADYTSLMSGAAIDKVTLNIGGEGQLHSHNVRLICM